MIAASFRHGFGNLLRFDGRDPPRLFWPYALILLVIACVVWSIIVFAGVPWQGTGSRAILVESGGVRVQSVNGAGVMLPDFAFLVAALAWIAGAYIALVGAAVVRRLHDSDRRGWWMLPPVLLLAIGLAAMRRTFTAFATVGELPDIDTFVLIFISNLVYLATLAILVVQLVRGASPGSNRFGPPSA